MTREDLRERLIEAVTTSHINFLTLFRERALAGEPITREDIQQIAAQQIDAFMDIEDDLHGKGWFKDAEGRCVNPEGHTVDNVKIKSAGSVGDVWTFDVSNVVSNWTAG